MKRFPALTAWRNEKRPGDGAANLAVAEEELVRHHVEVLGRAPAVAALARSAVSARRGDAQILELPLARVRLEQREAARVEGVRRRQEGPDGKELVHPVSTCSFRAPRRCRRPRSRPRIFFCSVAEQVLVHFAQEHLPRTSRWGGRPRSPAAARGSKGPGDTRAAAQSLQRRDLAAPHKSRYAPLTLGRSRSRRRCRRSPGKPSSPAPRRRRWTRRAGTSSCRRVKGARRGCGRSRPARARQPLAGGGVEEPLAQPCRAPTVAVPRPWKPLAASASSGGAAKITARAQTAAAARRCGAGGWPAAAPRRRNGRSDEREARTARSTLCRRQGTAATNREWAEGLLWPPLLLVFPLPSLPLRPWVRPPAGKSCRGRPSQPRRSRLG